MFLVQVASWEHLNVPSHVTCVVEGVSMNNLTLNPEHLEGKIKILKNNYTSELVLIWDLIW